MAHKRKRTCTSSSNSRTSKRVKVTVNEQKYADVYSKTYRVNRKAYNKIKLVKKGHSSWTLDEVLLLLQVDRIHMFSVNIEQQDKKFAKKVSRDISTELTKRYHNYKCIQGLSESGTRVFIDVFLNNVVYQIFQVTGIDLTLRNERKLEGNNSHGPYDYAILHEGFIVFLIEDDYDHGIAQLIMQMRCVSENDVKKRDLYGLVSGGNRWFVVKYDHRCDHFFRSDAIQISDFHVNVAEINFLTQTIHHVIMASFKATGM